MKMKQKGIAATAIAVIVIVVIAVAGAGAFLVLRGGGGAAKNATATVKLHDVETIDLAQVASQYIPNIAGVAITVSGMVTITSFEATDVTVKLHNKDTAEWITIVEGLDITNMIQVNELENQVSSGTYDKVSVYVGTVSVDMSWTDIVISYTVDYTQLGIPAEYLPYIESYLPGSGSYTVPSGSFDTQVTLNQTFEISLAQDVEVTEGEDQVFNVDTGAPMDFSCGLGQDMSWDMGENMSYGMQGGQLNQSCMSACGG